MGILKLLHGEVENFLQALDQGLDDMGFPPNATIMIYEPLIKDLQRRIAYLNQTGIDFKDY